MLLSKTLRSLSFLILARKHLYSKVKKSHFLHFILKDLFLSFLFFLALIISGNDTIFSPYTWMYFLYINVFPLLTFLSEDDTENMLGVSIAKKL